MPTEWRPSALLTGAPERPYAVIILNQPVNKNALSAVIDSATLLVCADAGGDRFLALGESSPFTRLPDAIVGDLDSLSKDAESHYRDKGVQIVKDPDQYSTDFSKALRWVRNNSQRNGSEDSTLDVIVMGGLGGRVDQGFSQIHYLYLAQQDEGLLRGRIYLLSEQSLTFVLDEGDNEMFVEPGTFEQNVGIIPVMGPTRISTKGLEWDVEDWLTEFGGQLSTSNHLQSNKIWLNVNVQIHDCFDFLFLPTYPPPLPTEVIRCSEELVVRALTDRATGGVGTGPVDIGDKIVFGA